MKRGISVFLAALSIAVAIGGVGALTRSGHWETYCSPDLASCWQELDPWTVPNDAPQRAVPEIQGDDNGDGVIDEDESGWDCRTMGNQICGDPS